MRALLWANLVFIALTYVGMQFGFKDTSYNHTIWFLFMYVSGKRGEGISIKSALIEAKSFYRKYIICENKKGYFLLIFRFTFYYVPKVHISMFYEFKVQPSSAKPSFQRPNTFNIMQCKHISISIIKVPC